MIIESSNFREIRMGKISPKTLYRSNHPICNRKQVPDIILAANYAKINTIINLSDNIQTLISKVAFCPWYKKIYESNSVITLNIDMQFQITNQRFKEKIKWGIQFMIEHDPPYLIHCEAGIDRTGFLSIVLESFMGAKFDDIVKDYMLSYVDINEYSANDYKNGSMFVRNMFSKIKGSLINSYEDLQYLSKKYLVEKIGLNANQIELLENRLGGSCQKFV
jgi:protein tyrosine/serine phosphatase